MLLLQRRTSHIATLYLFEVPSFLFYVVIHPLLFRMVRQVFILLWAIYGQHQLEAVHHHHGSNEGELRIGAIFQNDQYPLDTIQVSSFLIIQSALPVTQPRFCAMFGQKCHNTITNAD